MPTPFAPYQRINEGPVGLVLFIRMQTNLNSVTVTVEPTNQPQFGDIYFLGNGPNSGFQWAGVTNALAFYRDDGNWQFVTPDPSRIYTAADTGLQYVWNGTTFVLFTGGPFQIITPVVAAQSPFTVTASGLYLANAIAGPIQFIVSPALGNSTISPRIRIDKIDTSANQVTITNGVNTVDAIVTAAGANGQIGGWRDVSANGTSIFTTGTG